MKTYKLVIGLLVLAWPLAAKSGFTKHQVLTYAKALDVAKLDPTLSSQRLDKWLNSGSANVKQVTWEVSDCDLKPVEVPGYIAPLCVKVRLRKGDAVGWITITVGTFRDGISGPPRLYEIFFGYQTRDPSVGDFADSVKLSDLPRLLDEASHPANGL